MGVDPNLLFLLGVVFTVLSLPVLLAAWTHGESPRRGALMVLLAAGLITSAVVMRPGAYTIATAPQVLGEVVRGAIR